MSLMTFMLLLDCHRYFVTVHIYNISLFTSAPPLHLLFCWTSPGSTEREETLFPLSWHRSGRKSKLSHCIACHPVSSLRLKVYPWKVVLRKHFSSNYFCKHNYFLSFTEQKKINVKYLSSACKSHCFWSCIQCQIALSKCWIFFCQKK